MIAMPLLAVTDLRVTFGRGAEEKIAVGGVSFSIAPGEAYGLIGESGSGKTTIAFAILRYLDGGRITDGEIRLGDTDVLALDAVGLATLRGRRIAMVYQDPLSALNPLLTVGEQIAESLRHNRNLARAAAAAEAVRLLDQVHLPDPARAARRYPHQLSGGQQQRVVIAMALACKPKLLIMDEPTTGLDVTTEAVILDLVAELRMQLGIGILFISHNLGVVARVCDRIGVLYRGTLVEEGDADRVLRHPQHEYTRRLLAALPRIDRPLSLASPVAVRSPGKALLSVTNLAKLFRRGGGLFGRGQAVAALDGVSLTVREAETLAIVGESGSGKSTLARCIAGLISPDAGMMEFAGRPLPRRATERDRAVRRHIQMVFQNPEAALNPFHRIGDALARPLQLYRLVRGRMAQRARVDELLRGVRLEHAHASAFPRQLSGGQKQRVSVARAFAAEPRLIICDEPTSALDISVQAALLAELNTLQARFGTSYLFITHDLGVVRTVADRVAVMYLGRIVELGPVDAVFAPPHHPYTEALLRAVPTIEGAAAPPRSRLQGGGAVAVPDRRGCVFHARCPRKLGAICETTAPPRHGEDGRFYLCHIPPAELAALQGPSATPALATQGQVAGR